MPDLITHHLFCQQVLDNAALPPDAHRAIANYPSAFYWGAQGPDLLFYHRVLFGGSRLNAAAKFMHRSDTNKLMEEFIRILITAPKSCKDILISYFCGFLCHYALDSVMHPYVYFWQKEFCDINDDLSPSGAHSYVESSIDVALHQKTFGFSANDFDLKPFSLPTAQKNAIAWCYSHLIKNLCNETYPPQQIEECFADMLRMEKLFYGDHKFIARAVSFAEQFSGKRGAASGHFKLKSAPPNWDCLNLSHNSWQNPYTMTIGYESVFQLMQQAENDLMLYYDQYLPMIVYREPSPTALINNFKGEPIQNS